MSYYSGKFEVNTNLSSLILQNQFNTITSDIIKLMERVSTQQRVNSASDDPSGSALITGYNAQISSMKVAQDNSRKGIELLSTTESGLNSIKEELNNMKKYLEIARDATKTEAEKTEANINFKASISEIDRYASDTNYNGIKLLDGSNSADGKIVIQTDIKNNNASKFDISKALLNTNTHSLGIRDLQIFVSGSTIDLDEVEEKIDAATRAVDSRLLTSGTMMQSLNSNITRLSNQSKHLGETRDIILKADTASDTAELTKMQLLQQTTATLLQQANSSSSLALTLISRY